MNNKKKTKSWGSCSEVVGLRETSSWICVFAYFSADFYKRKRCSFENLTSLCLLLCKILVTWSLQIRKTWIDKRKRRRKGRTLHDRIKRRISSVAFLKSHLVNYDWLISIQIHQGGMYCGRNVAINCMEFNLLFWISSLWTRCALEINFWQSFTNALLWRIYSIKKNAPFASYGRPPACVLIKTREIIPCRLHTASIILRMLPCALR